MPEDFAECLEDLFARCPLTTPCVREGAAPGPFEECYEDGSRVESELGESPCGGGSPDRINSVYGSDGMLCYSVRLSAGLGCENPYMTWLDAAGAPVASRSGPYFAAGNMPRYNFRCGDGDWYTFAEPPVLPNPSSVSCVTGVCPGGEGGAAGEGGQAGGR